MPVMSFIVQVKAIVEKAVNEREAELVEQYDQILNERLAGLFVVVCQHLTRSSSQVFRHVPPDDASVTALRDTIMFVLCV